MRKNLILMLLLLSAAFSASARVNVSIGIHVPIFPQLVQVPSYPVYYAPELDSNYFFYDGEYWVYQDDYWYSSSWYDGPWELVEPEYVPLFILRVPVRYYRSPPRYFFGWYRDAPPRWHDHWGHQWAERRRGWDHWDRRAVPALAPLPNYQRHYSGDRYPRRTEQQHAVRSRNYNYQPREAIVQRHYQQPQREHIAKNAVQDVRRQWDQSQDRQRDPQRSQRGGAEPRQRMAAPQSEQGSEQRRYPQRDRQRDQAWERQRNAAPRQLMPPQSEQTYERNERRGQFSQPAQPMSVPEQRQRPAVQPYEQPTRHHDQRQREQGQREQVQRPQMQREQVNRGGEEARGRGDERGRGEDRGRGNERGRDRR